MKTIEDYQYDYIERIGIMCESGVTETVAHAEATFQVRQDMVNDGMGFAEANIKVMGIRKFICLLTIVLLLPCLVYAYDKPEYGHPFHNMNIKNFVREIDSSSDMKLIEPEWVKVLKRSPIINGAGIPNLGELRIINNEINRKESFALSSWMTPDEFQNAKQADCKAYATTKYYKLRELGWQPEDLNLWAGDYDGHAHLVLVARLNDKQYVLDIMNQHMPEAKDYFYKHFVPSYRFNEIGLDIE